ncbi:MAG: Flagellar basal-body rod protein FlgG [Firmicutes bacterium]|nr:Flagellar basal-body rod protein FlgG [Bacillota bacterium]
MLAGIKRSFSGLMAQMQRLSVKGANIANATTPGFKRTEGTFSEMLLSGLDGRHVPVISGEGSNLTRGVEFRGELLFTQGGLVATGRLLDIAVEGRGLIELVDGAGRTSYTRNGSFTLDGSGRIVHSSGGWLEGLVVPTGATIIDIDQEGMVSVAHEGGVVEIGRIRLTSFLNPAGLDSLGQSTYAATENSGPAEIDDQAKLHQGYLELSNVSLADEMTSLIRAQRAYQASSHAVRTLDEMWENVNALRR